LDGCPYDTNRNIKGLLTTDLFNHYLYVHKPSADKLIKKLNRLIDNPIVSKRIIFLTGFKGTGKTTFIKQYASQVFNPVYINLHELAQGTPGSPLDLKSLEDKGSRMLAEDASRISDNTSEKAFKVKENEVRQLLSQMKDATTPDSQPNPIVLRLKAYLSNGIPKQQIQELLSLFVEELDVIADYISEHFHAYLESEGKLAYGSKRVASTVRNAGSRDTFLLFLAYLFRFKAVRGEKTLVMFDNMDVIESVYLSEHFLKEFFEVRDQATSFSMLESSSGDSPLFNEVDDFQDEFVFLFCMRDTNFAVVNAHIQSSQELQVSQVPLTLHFSEDLYEDILRNRYQLAKIVCLDLEKDSEKEKVLAVINTISRLQNTRYFKEVVLPSFNYDYRRLIVILLGLAEKAGTVGVSKQLGHSQSDSDIIQTGINGNWMFGLIRTLREKDYLSSYPYGTSFSYFYLDADSDQAYCLPSRMILCFILNRCSGESGRSPLDSNAQLKFIPVSEVVEAFEGIIHPAEVLLTIARAFVFHRQHWVHLVSIQHWEVGWHGQFQLIMNWMELELKHIAKTTNSETEFVEALDALNADILRTLLESSVQITPAGFIFLKHILPHFEFYSTLANSSKPIFALNPSKPVDAESDYEFEEVASKVFRIVESHITRMISFFDLKLKGELVPTSEAYRLSDYSFKFIGDSPASGKGDFHWFRICTQHIGYLEQFRRLVILRRNLSAHGSSWAEDLNRRVLGIMKRYIDLLSECPDQRSQTHARHYLDKLEAIQSRDFKDFETLVVFKT